MDDIHLLVRVKSNFHVTSLNSSHSHHTFRLESGAFDFPSLMLDIT
jgi:hypothetical protein